jgi:hypothetical protein
MTTARIIITLALERMNKLSPGETVDADLGAVCLRSLNSTADDWNAGQSMQPVDQIVTGTVSGPSLALGSGAFAAIGYGDEITSMQSDGYPMEPVTMQRYNDIRDKAQTGRPQVWARDGGGTVFIFPAAVASTIAILTRKPFTLFADLDTVYQLPSGYQGAFAAALAVALAPSLLGGVPPALLAAERKAMANVRNGTVRPAIISANPLSCRPHGNILQGWR